MRAHSAGRAPSGRIHPFALETLHAAGIATDGARRKSRDEFTSPSAPSLAIVITVGDSVAAEVCPGFFGRSGEQPLKVHWRCPVPCSAKGGDAGRRRAFELTSQAIG